MDSGQENFSLANSSKANRQRQPAWYFPCVLAAQDACNSLDSPGAHYDPISRESIAVPVFLDMKSNHCESWPEEYL